MGRMIESVGLTLNQKCGNCHGPVHVPGLVRTLVCPHCAHKVIASWDGIGRDLAPMLGSRSGAKVGYTFIAAKTKSEGRFDAVRRRVRCSECEGEVDLAGLASESPELACRAGHPVSVRPAEKLAQGMVPGAVWLVGEGLVLEAGTQTDRDLLLINCKACGGELEIQPSQRDLTCGYCSSLNVVPDEVWIRLHPELQPREFFLVAAWDQEEAAAAEAGARVWHETRPKKRVPLYADEEALAAPWPAPAVRGFDWLQRQMTTGERQELARQKGLDAALVLRLASDPKVPVRERLAESRSLTAEAQLVLAGDDNGQVRRQLAERDDLSAAAAERLVEGADDKLLGLIERSRSLSVPVRLALARAGRPRSLGALEVRDVDGSELELLVAHAGGPEAGVLAAAHPKLTDAQIGALAGSAFADVRAALAGREGLSAEHIEALFHDPDGAVRAAVAKRSDLPLALQVELAEDDPTRLEGLLRRQDCPEAAFALGVASGKGSLHRLVAKHDGAPEEARVALAGVVKDHEAIKALLKQPRTPALIDAMVHSPSLKLREVVAFDPLTPAQLAVLASDEVPDIRKRVAGREDLPDDLALKLAGDPAEVVVARVQGHPAVVSASRRRKLKIAAVVVVVGAALTCAGLAAAGVVGLAGGLSTLFS